MILSKETVLETRATTAKQSKQQTNQRRRQLPPYQTHAFGLPLNPISVEAHLHESVLTLTCDLPCVRQTLGRPERAALF